MEETSESNDISECGYHLLFGDIEVGNCEEAIKWIMQENFKTKKKEFLTLVICSEGGLIDPAFALIDVIRGSSIPVRTIGLGTLSSAGLMIFMAGKKGKRILTPNTMTMSHQYSWGSSGKEHELFASIRGFDLNSKRVLKHYESCLKMTKKEIRKILLPPKDVWLSAKEALKYGICDSIKEFKT